MADCREKYNGDPAEGGDKHIETEKPAGRTFAEISERRFEGNI